MKLDMKNLKDEERVENEVEEEYDYMNEVPLQEDEIVDDEYEDVIECD
jgi:hypothetical protein